MGTRSRKKAQANRIGDTRERGFQLSRSNNDLVAAARQANEAGMTYGEYVAKAYARAEKAKKEAGV